MKKSGREVYKDPVYGIPHFHDPALSRIMMKHDPSYQVSRSMKMIFVKSSQRLRAVRANKPKYLHTRFNIDTLLTSPLMVFPHFQDMTDYISRWFMNREARQRAALTSNQKATFVAQERFVNSLFLLLQESARASPVSPTPLKGIYNWYLQRDSVIDSSRMVEKKVGLDEFFIIELSNGQEIRVPRNLVGPERLLDLEEIFSEENIEETMRVVPVHEDPPPPVIPPKIKKRNIDIITKTSSVAVPRRLSSSSELNLKFDYDTFHKELVARRQAERDVDTIAENVRKKRLWELGRTGAWK